MHPVFKVGDLVRDKESGVLMKISGYYLTKSMTEPMYQFENHTATLSESRLKLCQPKFQSWARTKATGEVVQITDIEVGKEEPFYLCSNEKMYTESELVHWYEGAFLETKGNAKVRINKFAVGDFEKYRGREFLASPALTYGGLEGALLHDEKVVIPLTCCDVVKPKEEPAREVVEFKVEWIYVLVEWSKHGRYEQGKVYTGFKANDRIWLRDSEGDMDWFHFSDFVQNEYYSTAERLHLRLLEGWPV